MPSKVEHIHKEGRELKWCPWCKDYLSLSEFHSTNGRTWDGLFWICKDHANEKRRKSKSINAAHVWRNMQIRVAKDKRYVNKGIQVKITQEEFTLWYRENWFEGCLVDRIDNNGHYEISNLQLLSRTDHNHKARFDKLQSIGVVEPDGFRYCYSCGELKKYNEFYRRAYKVSDKTPLGLNESCMECCRKERRERFRLLRR
jgi:hypothetical protein